MAGTLGQRPVNALTLFVNGEGIKERGRYGQRQVDDSFLLLFNGHHEPLQFTLPPAEYGEKWQVVFDTALPGAGAPADGAGRREADRPGTQPAGARPRGVTCPVGCGTRANPGPTAMAAAVAAGASTVELHDWSGEGLRAHVSAAHAAGLTVVLATPSGVDDAVRWLTAADADGLRLRAADRDASAPPRR